MDQPTALQPAQWVNRYADILNAYILVRINDTGAAADMVQDTFLSAWKGRSGYDGRASEKNWLFAICKNKIIDYYRKQSTGMAKVVSPEENEYFDGVDHWTPVTQPNKWGIDQLQPFETKEFYGVLEKCKRKLKDIQQMVFVMKYMEELESDEICKLLELTPAYYWVLIHRAKLHLRSCLEKNWINI